MKKKSNKQYCCIIAINRKTHVIGPFRTQKGAERAFTKISANYATITGRSSIVALESVAGVIHYVDASIESSHR